MNWPNHELDARDGSGRRAGWWALVVVVPMRLGAGVPPAASASLLEEGRPLSIFSARAKPPSSTSFEYTPSPSPCDETGQAKGGVAGLLQMSRSS